jgi:hypothetical protein
MIWTCGKCNNEFERTKKYPRSICKPCFRKWTNEYYARTNGDSWKKYAKTKSGFCVRLYRNMTNRVRGINKKARKNYMGLYILPKQEFYDWILNNQTFHELFSVWEVSGYERKLTPSVDRIDPERGYSLDNMRIVTFSENCRNTRRWK